MVAPAALTRRIGPSGLPYGLPYAALSSMLSEYSPACAREFIFALWAKILRASETLEESPFHVRIGKSCNARA